MRRRVGSGILAAVLVIAAGCGEPSAAPQTAARNEQTLGTATAADGRGRGVADVTVQVRRSDRSYEVPGTTARDVFAAMRASGLSDLDGKPAVGLTRTVAGYEVRTGGAPECRVASMSITLDVTVTLPRLAAPELVDAAVAAHWPAFAEGVTAHEEEHVAIATAAAERAAAVMRELAPEREGCEALERTIAVLWEAEWAKERAEQEAFHVREEARLAPLRAPLQTKLDATNGRIEDVAAEIEAVGAQVAAADARVSAIGAQIEPLRRRFPDLVFPEPQYSQYSRLVRDYNAAVAEYNALVRRKNGLVDEHNVLAAEANALGEELAWIG